MNQSLHLNRKPAPAVAAASDAPAPTAITVEHYRLLMGQFEDDEAKLEEYYQ